MDSDDFVWSKSEDHLDPGHGDQLSRWRIPLHLEYVIQDVRHVRLRVQPDALPAAFEIEEGMTWQRTNTLSF